MLTRSWSMESVSGLRSCNKTRPARRVPCLRSVFAAVGRCHRLIGFWRIWATSGPHLGLVLKIGPQRPLHPDYVWHAVDGPLEIPLSRERSTRMGLPDHPGCRN
jgi:hypothetical protein